jgi:hypothetical protein
MGALKLRYGPQHRQQEPQVRGDGRLQQDLPADQFLDLQVQGVNDPLALGQHLHRLAAASLQGLGRPGQVLSDHAEQFDDLGFDGLQPAVDFATGLPRS